MPDWLLPSCSPDANEGLISFRGLASAMVYPYCLTCRGTRDLCRQGRCELLQSVRERIPRVRPVGRIVEGPSPPDVFVGQYGYPTVRVGPLVPPSEAVDEGPVLSTVKDLVEAPIEDVVAYRTLLYHTRQGASVSMRREMPRILEVAREKVAWILENYQPEPLGEAKKAELTRILEAADRELR